jgi:hypothetical protein
VRHAPWAHQSVVDAATENSESATSTNAVHPQHLGGEDLEPREDLIQQTPGAHPIGSVDELRCDAFETDEELDDFLAFIAESRHADLAPRSTTDCL